MEKIYWDKLGGFRKFIFCLGWLSVLNFVFWLAMVIYYFVAKEKQFFSPGSYRVVYVFGWINLISFFMWILIGVLWVVVVNIVNTGV